MVLNIILVIFLLLMAYWWALQGFFSAWLHLGIVIVSGAIALAVFEPMAHWLLGTGSFASLSAWGIALLAPFGVAILVLRTAMDRLVPKNVNFPDLANKIGGGIVGVLSGILTSGIIVIGLGFLPLGDAIGGIQPYTIGTNGQITENDANLWFGVDRWTASFYRGLSGGAFTAGFPMAQYLPDLARDAATFRVHVDPNSSSIAVPEAVTIKSVFAQPAAEAQKVLDPSVIEKLGDRLGPGKQIVVVDTHWKPEPRGTYDTNTLRLPPAHMQLIYEKADGTFGEVEATALSQHNRDLPRIFVLAESNTSMVGSNRQEETIAAMFIIGDNETPRYVKARKTRLPSLPAIDREAAKLAAVVGKFTPPDQLAEATTPDTKSTPLAPPEGGVRLQFVGALLELTPLLPNEVSTNSRGALNYNAERQIHDGSADIEKFNGRISQQLAIKSLYEGAGRCIVRIKIEKDSLMTVAGNARALAAQFNPPMIVDNFGEQHFSIGYVLLRTNGSQLMKFDRVSQIMRAANLPIAEMNEGDELYLYFDIPREARRRLVSFEVGDRKQEIPDGGVPVE